jgi:hypothetical protein
MQRTKVTVVRGTTVGYGLGCLVSEVCVVEVVETIWVIARELIEQQHPSVGRRVAKPYFQVFHPRVNHVDVDIHVDDLIRWTEPVNCEAENSPVGGIRTVATLGLPRLPWHTPARIHIELKCAWLGEGIRAQK